MAMKTLTTERARHARAAARKNTATGKGLLAKSRAKPKTDVCDGCGTTRPIVRGEIHCPYCERFDRLEGVGTFWNLAVAFRIEAATLRKYAGINGMTFIADSFDNIANAIYPPFRSAEEESEFNAAEAVTNEYHPDE